VRDVAERHHPLELRVGLHRRNCFHRRHARAVQVEDDERRPFLPHGGEHVLPRSFEVDLYTELLGGGLDLDREEKVVEDAHDHGRW
jgi:hypothetical protein